MQVPRHSRAAEVGAHPDQDLKERIMKALLKGDDLQSLNFAALGQGVSYTVSQEGGGDWRVAHRRATF